MSFDAGYEFKKPFKVVKKILGSHVIQDKRGETYCVMATTVNPKEIDALVDWLNKKGA